MAVRCLASKHGIKRPWSECEDSESDEEGVDWERSVHHIAVYRAACMDEWCEMQMLMANSTFIITEARSASHHGKLQRVLNPYLTAFFRLLDDDIIQDFLWVDSCAKLADKYLLAMVYVYFRRASLEVHHYNRINFFIALYLANDMEEDEEEEKYEIFPWALGGDWMTQFPHFLARRDELWHKMKFRAVVSRRTCEEVIGMFPEQEVWQRVRLPHHGGAIRAHLRPSSPRYGRTSPTYCEFCSKARRVESLYQETLSHESPPLPKMDLLDEIDCSFASGCAVLQAFLDFVSQSVRQNLDLGFKPYEDCPNSAKSVPLLRCAHEE